MKTLSLVRFVTFGLLSSATLISAQNLANQVPESITRPTIQKVESVISDSTPLCLVKNSMELDSQMNNATETAAVVDLSVLREPSIYTTGPTANSGMPEDMLRTSLALLSATYRESAKISEGKSSMEIASSVRQQIKIDPYRTLEIVGCEISANPSAACEIVKVAIQTTDADPSLVVSIVKSAVQASPESMRMISQCAIASAPESLPAIQALLAELDPNAGDSGTSAKSTKNAIHAIGSKPPEPPKPNPLDLPPLYPIPPGPITPALVTNVNP